MHKPGLGAVGFSLAGCLYVRHRYPPNDEHEVVPILDVMIVSSFPGDE